MSDATGDARRVIARAPTRLDFGGGWTDVPPYSSEVGGFVCNVAIARHATALVTHTPCTHPAAGHGARAGHDSALAAAALRHAGLAGLRVELTSDFPVGAGLGGSSAAGVATTGALDAWRGAARSPEALAEESRCVEVEELGVAGGRQDHYAAALGGALALRFVPGGGVEARRIALTPATTAALEQQCIVAYTGEARVSANTITAVLDAYRARDGRVTGALARMATLAEQMAAALAAGDVASLGALVGEHWVHQRALHPAIPTPLIDRLLADARRAGALGGKALGASGGGCVLAIAPPEQADAVRAALAAHAQLLPFTVDLHGFHVVRD